MDTATTSALDIAAVARPSRSLPVRQVIRDFWTLTNSTVS